MFEDIRAEHGHEMEEDKQGVWSTYTAGHVVKQPKVTRMVPSALSTFLSHIHTHTYPTSLINPNPVIDVFRSPVTDCPVMMVTTAAIVTVTVIATTVLIEIT